MEGFPGTENMVNPIRLTDCATADLPALVELCRQQWEDGESDGLPQRVVEAVRENTPFDEFVREYAPRMRVAHLRGEVAGFLVRDGDEVLHIGVLPARWRQGVGRALMQDAEAQMQAAGYAEARVQVHETNARAIAFYVALGYTVTAGHLNDDWGAPVPMLVMCKPLPAP
jgi:putative acetyltransferase